MADGEAQRHAADVSTYFCCCSLYYLLKTVREALILTEGGAYVKAYSSAGQAALLMLLVPLYGYIGTKVVRIRLIAGLLLFFIANLAIFYFFGVNGAREGVVFYIWVGIFNVFIISQVWAFANDIYTEGARKAAVPDDRRGQQPGRMAGCDRARARWSPRSTPPVPTAAAGRGHSAGLRRLDRGESHRERARSIPEIASHARQKLAPATASP